jgi:hypothetical protein
LMSSAYGSERRKIRLRDAVKTYAMQIGSKFQGTPRLSCASVTESPIGTKTTPNFSDPAVPRGAYRITAGDTACYRPVAVTREYRSPEYLYSGSIRVCNVCHVPGNPHGS